MDAAGLSFSMCTSTSATSPNRDAPWANSKQRLVQPGCAARPTGTSPRMLALQGLRQRTGLAAVTSTHADGASLLSQGSNLAEDGLRAAALVKTGRVPRGRVSMTFSLADTGRMETLRSLG